MNTNSKKIGLYIHFPFCLRKCPYCDFISYDKGPVDREKYIDMVRMELQSFNEQIGLKLEAKSIYLGGGTPSLMTSKQIEKLVGGINRQAPCPADTEITIEVNPATAGETEMAEWRSIGINRISLGLQSTDLQILRKLERIHKAEDGVNAYKLARKTGFSSVSIDLIFGVPGQSLEEWKADLGRAIALGPDHISAYMLKAPAGWTPPPDEEVASMYLFTVETLEKAGLSQYEVSNFARPGHQCRHNLNYWKNGDYLGLGVAAHSHISALNSPSSASASHPVAKQFPTDTIAIRWWNTTDPQEFINQIGENGNAIKGYEYINAERAFNENLLLGLRLREGLNMGEMSLSHRAAIEKEKNRLIESGLAHIDGSVLKLTPPGMLLADEIAARIAAAIRD